MARGRLPGVYNQEARPIDVGDGTSQRNNNPRPGSMGDGRYNGTFAGKWSAADVLKCWELAKPAYVGGATLRACGEQYVPLLNRFLPYILGVFDEFLTGTVCTQVVGGSSGTLSGGVGELPGAMANDQIGTLVGDFFTERLSMSFMTQRLGDRLGVVGDRIINGVKRGWDSNGNEAIMHLSAQEFAEGVGAYFGLLVGEVMSLISEMGIVDANRLLRNSYFGNRFSQLFERDANMRLDYWMYKLGMAHEPRLVRVNVETAVSFLRRYRPDATDDDIVSYIKAIDLSRPVSVVEMKPDVAYAQWFGSRIGSFFAKPGTPIERLGIARGVRQLKHFSPTVNVPALSSTAAPANDTWTDRKTVKSLIRKSVAYSEFKLGMMVPGGSPQLMAPDTSSFKEIDRAASKPASGSGSASAVGVATKGGKAK